MSRSSRRAGFTLVETSVALALVATGALLLGASVASCARTSSLAREREVAARAMSAYLAAMRSTYPPPGTYDMTGFLADQQTPADARFLARGAGGFALRDVRSVVLKEVDETGLTWGPVAVSGTVAAPGSAVAAIDRAALGMPRDLDGDALATNPLVRGRDALVIPIRIELSWSTGSGSGSTTPRQTLVLHASLGPQH